MVIPSTKKQIPSFARLAYGAGTIRIQAVHTMVKQKAPRPPRMVDVLCLTTFTSFSQLSTGK